MQEKKEADFRYGLVRVRENAESIAFYGGEENEVQLLIDRFKRAFENLSVSSFSIELHSRDVTMHYTIYFTIPVLGITISAIYSQWQKRPLKFWFWKKTVNF